MGDLSAPRRCGNLSLARLASKSYHCDPSSFLLALPNSYSSAVLYRRLITKPCHASHLKERFMPT